jgi:L-lysine exporter family protein LysE/ArgO
METIVRNILLGIALAAPIGPAGIAVIQSGLNCGFWNAFRTGIGITLADTTYLLVVFFGLSNFMKIPSVKLGLWTLGAFILMYLGILSIKGALRGFDFEQTHRSINKNPMISGYLVNISNPLAVLFWVGIFGSSIEQSVSESKVIVLLVSSMILVGILIWHSTMSLLSNWGKRYLNEKTLTFISVSAGVGLLAFGVKFAYSVVVLMIE